MSAIYDLRSFLALLEQHGQLSRIKKPVSIIHESADIGATIERTGAAAPLFENIGFDGWRLFSSAVANQERVALALGCTKNEVTARMAFAMEPANAIPPVLVKDAVWKRRADRCGQD